MGIKINKIFFLDKDYNITDEELENKEECLMPYYNK